MDRHDLLDAEAVRKGVPAPSRGPASGAGSLARRDRPEPWRLRRAARRLASIASVALSATLVMVVLATTVPPGRKALRLAGRLVVSAMR